jgi:hypothetical protein
VAATNAIATDHIDNIQVNLRYGGHPPRSVLLTAEAPTATVEWALDPALGWIVQYDAQISFRTDAAAGAASSLQLGPFTKVGNRVEINPRDHYAILPIEIDAIAIPWDRYSQIEVCRRRARSRPAPDRPAIEQQNHGPMDGSTERSGPDLLSLQDHVLYCFGRRDRRRLANNRAAASRHQGSVLGHAEGNDHPGCGFHQSGAPDRHDELQRSQQ